MEDQRFSELLNRFRTRPKYWFATKTQCHFLRKPGVFILVYFYGGGLPQSNANTVQLFLGMGCHFLSATEGLEEPCGIPSGR